MAENTERDRLFKKYPYVVAWGQLLGSRGYSIERHCREAEKDGMGQDAVYKNGDGSWRVLSELKDESQEELEQYVAGHKGGEIIH